MSRHKPRNATYFPGVVLSEKYPTMITHLIEKGPLLHIRPNLQQTPIAYSRFCLNNPFCTDKISKPYNSHTAPLLHILILSLLVFLFECCLINNNQWKDPKHCYRTALYHENKVSYRECIVFPYQMGRQLPYDKVSPYNTITPWLFRPTNWTVWPIDLNQDQQIDLISIIIIMM